MKRILLFSNLFFFILTIQAQEIKGYVRIGLLTSFYLDNAFDSSGNYKLQKKFPKQAASGLEFYEGASLAIDSLNKMGYLATMRVYDLQSKETKIDMLSQSGVFDSLNLLISHTGAAEYLELASIAKEKKITLINANYPNDGGIRNNENVFIVNPKINTHLTALHTQITKKWSDAKIIWFKRNEPTDDRLHSIMNELNESSKKISFQTITLDANFIATDITSQIDSTKVNVLIAGSIDEAFAIKFAKAVVNYPKKGILNVIGMPNWDGLKEIQNKSYTSLPIYYTSGFFAPPGNKWLAEFDNIFTENIGTKSSLAAIRGFELTYFFGLLWASKGAIDTQQLIDPALRIITDYDFRPVILNTDNEKPDYFENKRIYFIRRLNGLASLQ